MKLKDYLRDTLELGRDDVFKVDVKDSFSFFNTEKEHQEKVLAFFTDFKENGRFINVEITEDRGGRDRKRGGGRRRDGGNDRRRRSDKPKGERRSRRSEDSNSSNKKSKRSNRDKSEFKSTHGRPRRSRR